MRFTREQVKKRLCDVVAGGRAVIAAGAGIGLSAKFAEKGGADLIVIYNAARYRMTGFSSMTGMLPIGDANAIVLEMGEREILPMARNTPVITGVFASDPSRDMGEYLRKVKDMGFSGVINSPSVSLYEGALRKDLEKSGLGFGCELEMVRQAHAMELYTMAYVFSPEEAAQMAEAGVDMIVAHMAKLPDGPGTALERSVTLTKAIGKAATDVNPDVVVLCHGGPIAFPEDARFVIAGAGCQGFVGASSVERLPAERGLLETLQAFKDIPI